MSLPAADTVPRLAEPSFPSGVSPRSWRLLLGVVLAAYACVQFFYITATPLLTVTLPDNLPNRSTESILVGLGPDESEHFLYILSLADGGALPMPDPAHRTSPRQYVTYQAQHPPLFYALAALVYKAASGLPPPAVWYLLRALCAACGGVVIVLAARAARLSFPNRPFFALAAAPAVAFLPMFGYMNAHLSNEPLGMVFGAAAWLQLVRLARGRTPYTVASGAFLGVTLGLAALTRLTALLWMPAVLLVFGYCAQRETGIHRVRPLLACALCFALLLAPWLVHNQVTFGSLLVRSYHRPLIHGTLSHFVLDPYFTPYLMLTALWDSATAWCPFWLMQFSLPGGPNAAPFWQALFLLLNIFLLLTLIWNGRRARQHSEAPDREAPDAVGRLLLWSAFCAVAFCVLVLFQQCLFTDWQVMNYGGRYLAAATPASALLLVTACAAWVRPAVRPAKIAAGVLAALLLGFDAYTVVLVQQFYRAHPSRPGVQRLTSRL